MLLFGMSSKFHQWIPGIILSQEIKKYFNNTKIIVGGFGNKESAMEAMKLNEHFDFATWGEGEYPLLELSKQLQNKTDNFQVVPRLLFRENNEIISSEQIKSNYLDFENYILPNYEDFFKQYTDEKYKITIPINSVRACHWNKCKFCDFNRGYKYRVRTPESIIQEIEYITNKYEHACYSFVDNDIFVNAEHFEKLLDLIIESINKYNFDYEFWAEMIPHKMLNAQLLEKMKIAGFTQVFIGYDAISDTLLRKMNKSNNLSNNIFFLKYALKNGIDPLVNIIKGVIDETQEDIEECIQNLHFLRFYFNDSEISFMHDYTPLVISKMTKYYAALSDKERDEYSANKLADLLPPEFSNHSNRFCLFRWEKKELDHAAQWQIFYDKESYYKENKFSYKLAKNQGVYIYTEYQNGIEISNQVFNETDYWGVLIAANQKVCPFQELYAFIKQSNPKFTTNNLKTILTKLKQQHLIYCDNELNHVITIIDCDEVLENKKAPIQ